MMEVLAQVFAWLEPLIFFREDLLKDISGSTTMEPSVSTPSTLKTSYSGSEAFSGASARHPLNTSSNTGDLFILRSSLTLTCPSASAELGLGGGELESLRQAPFRVSRLGTAPVMSSSSSPFPLALLC